MSTLESFIWHFLGYATMPAIFIGGFIATALVFCFIMDKAGKL
ncbi:TIGR02808 family protein [Endozoicomonas sp.]